MRYRKQESSPTIGTTIRMPVEISEELEENSHAMRISKNSAILQGISMWNQMVRENQKEKSGNQQVG